MRVTLLLADAAQVAGDKLYVLGGGWRFAGPGPTPMALACIFEVPYDQANLKIPFEFELVDADGHPAQMPGGGELKIGGEVEVGRPAGHPRGTPLVAPMAINIPGLPLVPGGYEWKLTVKGESLEDWRLPFTIRETPFQTLAP